MRIAIGMLLLLAAAGVAAAAWLRLNAGRDTSATIPCTAKVPGKVAIVYYSQSKVRNTAIIAEWIRKHVGGDVIVIDAVEPYPEPYFRTLAAATLERKSGKKRPIRPTPSLAGYDVVFLGSPIWYGTHAFPVELFLRANPLAGKTVVPFSTHGGGGAPLYERDVKAACPQAKVLPGFTARGSNQVERRLGTGVTAHHAEDDVVRWLNETFGERMPRE
ncbi:MAG: flavodoxin [Kiritimatiellae bacterium]|nr:flavodoxin [Kiritimatiellia bacterium]